MPVHNIIKHDPVHCLAPGLFTSIARKKGDKKCDNKQSEKRSSRPDLNITYKRGNVTVTFEGKQLGADDLLVLQGLVSLAGRSETGLISLPSKPTTEAGQALRDGLGATGDAVEQDALIVKCDYKAYFVEVGRVGGGKAIKDLKACLKRLFAISIFIKVNGRESGHRLLSYYESDKAGLQVALNQLITSAIIGDGRYIKIDMCEVRAIKSDVTRIIHQRLCGFLRPGEVVSIGIDSLVPYVYPTASVMTTTIKKRRAAVRAAIAELAELGWPITHASGIYRIARP